MKCERCDGHGEVNLDQVGAGAWVVCKNCNGKGVYPAREAKLIVAVRKLRDDLKAAEGAVEELTLENSKLKRLLHEALEPGGATAKVRVEAKEVLK